MGNPWFEHVAKFRKENPELSYSEALKQAKKSYMPVIKNCPPCTAKNNTSQKEAVQNKKEKKVKNDKKVSKKSNNVTKKVTSKKSNKKEKKSKRKPSAWNIHVMDTKKKNPKMAFKDVLVEAAKTYKK